MPLVPALPMVSAVAGGRALLTPSSKVPFGCWCFRCSCWAGRSSRRAVDVSEAVPLKPLATLSVRTPVPLIVTGLAVMALAASRESVPALTDVAPVKLLEPVRDSRPEVTVRRV